MLAGNPPSLDETGQAVNPRERRQPAQASIPDAVLGFGQFLANYLPGGRRSLGDDMTAPYLPYDAAVARYGDDMGQELNDAQQSLPEWAAYLNSLYRMAWFDPSQMPSSTPDAKRIMDRSDNYLGVNQDYLRRMRNMPEYLRPLAPLIARGAHLIAKAPGPSWSPPYLPGFEPQYDELAPETEGTFTLEPNVYYDDPYIPGPDKGRKRSA